MKSQTKTKHSQKSVSRSKKKAFRRWSSNLKKNTNYIWCIFIYSATSISLFWLILIKGWSPIYSENIYIKGSSNLSLKTILNTTKLKLPQRVLSLNPHELEKKLEAVLPINKAIVRRYLIPPRVEISLLEKSPLAYGTRRKGSTIEKGLVDIKGDWIPIKFLGEVSSPSTQLSIEGWMPSHKRRISIVLKHRNQLGSPLQKILISPNGEMTIKTEELGLIELGFDDQRLVAKLKATAHLNDNLPTKFRNKAGMIVDMRDPSKPELQFSEPSR